MKIPYWVLPLIVTLFAGAWAYFADRQAGAGYGAAIASLFHWGLALIATLVAWLIYALLA